MSGVGELGKAVIGQILEGAIRALTGDKPIGDAVRDAIKDAAGETAELLEFRARQLVEQFGLVLAVRDVADQVAEVPKAFTPDGSVPDLNLEMTIVGPDEKLEETTVQPVDEKFDDGAK